MQVLTKHRDQLCNFVLILLSPVQIDFRLLRLLPVHRISSQESQYPDRSDRYFLERERGS